jgi:hypothetical protein
MSTKASRMLPRFTATLCSHPGRPAAPAARAPGGIHLQP